MGSSTSHRASSGHSSRRSLRRAVRTRCQAVEVEGFTLIGERVLDLSPRGMLIACDAAAELGDEVVVSFRAPGRDTLWLDAEAHVARIVRGLRDGDFGFCVGLDFTYLEKSAREELLVRLAGHPPPIPQRRAQPLKVNRDIHELSVLVRPIIPVWPKGFSQKVPLGVFG